MEMLKEVPEFVVEMGAHAGGLKIPIGRMVIFPKIGRDEFFDRGLHWLIPMERVMVKEDLAAEGQILCDESGRKFKERISGAFPFRYSGITPKEIAKLSSLIWHESQIKLPLRKGAGKTRFQREVQALDEVQARLARRLKSGHQIIKGPPGSGKTLVLVHRCCHIHQYHPQKKNILLVCYNIALVSYLKRLIQEKGVGVGNGGIHVSHYYELCSKILGEPVQFENEDNEYYDMIVEETISRVAKGEGRLDHFDAILIDEGQDFSNEMLKAVLGILRSGGDLVIALDSYQDLYSRRGSWKSLGIQAVGRTSTLGKVYRNTYEIFSFTQRFIGESEKFEKQLALLQDDHSLHGDPPELQQFVDYDGIENFLIDDLSKCLGQGEYKRSEVAVIYDDKVYGLDRFAYDNRALPMRVRKKLEASGFPTTWVSQDVRAKEMYDVTTDRVSLISVHSSKGLDFDLVYLIGVDRIQPTELTRGYLRNLIYVAMTRAKYRLVIPYERETEFIKRMKHCLTK
jgi:superfamily I DNA and RNA helicase